MPIKYCLLIVLWMGIANKMYSQIPTWQYDVKMGTNTSYTSNNGNLDEMQVIAQMSDQHLNQYILLYVTGDTFYYDSLKIHFPIQPGCSGAVLLKIRCDGSLAWHKVFRYKDPYKSNGPESFKMCFGKNENQILIGLIVSYESIYMDIDTLINAAGSIYRYYSILYDSSGVYQKTIYRDKNVGQAVVQGYIPASNQYYFFMEVDSIWRPITHGGVTYQSGMYLMLMDSNFYYNKIVPVYTRIANQDTYNFDTTQPMRILNISDMPTDPKFNFFVVNHKIYCMLPVRYIQTYRDNYNKRLIIARDTYDFSNRYNNENVSVLFCYNDTGKFIFSNVAKPFRYPLIPQSARALFGSPNFIMGSDKNFYYICYNDFKDSVMIWNGDTIISKLSSGVHNLNYGSIDTNGKLLWSNDLEYFFESPYSNYFDGRITLTPNNEIVLLSNMFKWQATSFGSSGLIFKLGGTWYRNDTIEPIYDYNTKPILMKLGRYSQELIDICQNGIRVVEFDHISSNRRGDIFVYGKKLLKGYTLNQDSSNIIYNGIGYDYFIAKYGTSVCVCDTVSASFIIDSSAKPKISVSYTGSPSDSVRYLWGDGTSSVVKPSTMLTTHFYTKTILAEIKCIVRSSCGDYDTAIQKVLITCDTIHNDFQVLSQVGKTIQVVYTGQAIDSVRYLWGDGQESLANPSTTKQSHTYSQPMWVTISSIVKTPCGGYDTTSHRIQIICDTIHNDFQVLSQVGKTIQVVYTGSKVDTVKYIWGDGSSWVVNTSVTMPQSHTYSNVYDSVKVSCVIKNKCGENDTMSRWVVFCMNKSSYRSITFCDSIYTLIARTDSALTFVSWSDLSTQRIRKISSSMNLAGIYTTAGGCIYRDSMGLTKYTSPLLNKDTLEMDCKKSKIKLDATQSQAKGYNWSNGSTNSSIEVNQKGVYSVLIKHPCGLYRDSFWVGQLDTVYKNTITKRVCSQYQWFDSVYTQAGLYHRQYTSSKGCDSMVTLDLQKGLELKLKVIDGKYYSVDTGFKSYQWYICSPKWSKIANETKPILYTSTNYKFAVVVSDGVCTDTSECIDKNYSSIGIAMEVPLILYPNPTNGQLTIEGKYLNKPLTKLTLYNSLGQKVMEESVNRQTRIEINLSSLPNGIYQIKLENELGVFLEKVTKY